MCPECGSTQVTTNAFDFGICLQTGYRDAGERFHCRECGAQGDADETRVPPCEGEARVLPGHRGRRVAM